MYGKRYYFFTDKNGSSFIHDIRKWITRRSIFTVSFAIADYAIALQMKIFALHNRDMRIAKRERDLIYI